MTARGVVALVATLLALSAARAAAAERHAAMLAAEHGGQSLFFVDVDRFEYRAAQGSDDPVAWEARASFGSDVDRFALATEGERSDAANASRAEVEALYSRTVTDFFDVEVGARHDYSPDPERSFAVVRLVGLAPYWVHVDAAAFLSDEGEASARLKLQSEVRITQRLLLIPRIETNASAQDVAERRIGSGIDDVDAGFRLAYEVRRELAPYVGASWHRLFGDTADFARAAGEHTSELALIAGVRFWY